MACRFTVRPMLASRQPGHHGTVPAGLKWPGCSRAAMGESVPGIDRRDRESESSRSFGPLARRWRSGSRLTGRLERCQSRTRRPRPRSDRPAWRTTASGTRGVAFCSRDRCRPLSHLPIVQLEPPGAPPSPLQVPSPFSPLTSDFSTPGSDASPVVPKLHG